MRHIQELGGRDLDTWVAKAEGFPTRHWRRVIFIPDYCSDWRAGGPIIERARIRLLPDVNITNAGWHASMPGSDFVAFGRTPLEAAMRCYVAHTFGETLT
jgi:hypothetical protein